MVVLGCGVDHCANWCGARLMQRVVMLVCLMSCTLHLVIFKTMWMWIKICANSTTCADKDLNKCLLSIILIRHLHFPHPLNLLCFPSEESNSFWMSDTTWIFSVLWFESRQISSIDLWHLNSYRNITYSHTKKIHSSRPASQPSHCSPEGIFFWFSFFFLMVYQHTSK